MNIPAEENFCRLCSEHCALHFSLFENNAAQMLDSLTSIKIKTDDPFTTRICLNCFSDLNNAYRIQQKIIENQKKFTESLDIKKICVKEEVIDDVCTNTTNEETTINFLEDSEVKMEVQIDEDLFDSQCSESDNSNLIAETNYGLVEEDVVDFDEGKTLDVLKSRQSYQHSYKQFMKWREENHPERPFSEKILLAYFKELATKTAPTSLWTHYSMLKRTLITYQKVNITRYNKLKIFLKSKSTGYKPKKTLSLSKEEINRFLHEAPDDEYLLVKVVIIVSVCGACQKYELVRLTIDDIEDLDGAVRIKIPKSTKNSRDRYFTITGNFYKTFKKYASLRPPNTVERRFFLTYHNKRCTSQPAGKNKIGTSAKLVATYLGLKEAELYTFVSLRLNNMLGVTESNKYCTNGCHA